MSSLPNLPSDSSGSLKVAIPRLIQKNSPPPRKSATSRLNRVNRACLSCRSRKIKCNGTRPTCANCSDSATSCVYASSRKDRLKTATGQNLEMIALLRDLRDQVSDGGRTRIDELLASVVEDVADAADSLSMSTDTQEAEFRKEPEEANGSSTCMDFSDNDTMPGGSTRLDGQMQTQTETQTETQTNADKKTNDDTQTHQPPHILGLLE